MKRIISIILLLATVFSLFSFEISASDLVDQVQSGAVVSYRDSTESYGSPTCGRCVSTNAYPRPGEVWSVAPTTYTFLMINLQSYSAAARSDLKEDLPLDDAFFTGLERTLQNARDAGVGLGIRFRFDDRGRANQEPDWDNLIGMLEDVRDSGLFREYNDVVCWCELGTLGAYGEQWNTRYGNDGYITELIDLYLQIFAENVPITLRTGRRIANWLNSKLGEDFCTQATLNKALNIRTLYPEARNDTADYYSGDGRDFSTGNLLADDLARLGYYNDGYLGTNTDYSTFENRANETAFLNGQENATYGGESSGDRYYQIYQKDYTTCWWPENGIPEMYYTHLMYLHGSSFWAEKSVSHDFIAQKSNATVLRVVRQEAETFVERLEHVYNEIGADHLKGTSEITEIRKEGVGEVTGYRVTYIAPGFESYAFDEKIAKAVREKTGSTVDLSEYYGVDARKFITDHMGYRFVLRSSMMSRTVKAGEKLSVALSIDNTGFSKLIGDETLQIILYNGRTKYTNTLSDIDPTSWKSMTTNEIKAEISVPRAISGGEWGVYIRIADKNSPDGSKANVRFANEDIYNITLGANLVGMINIESDFVMPKRELTKDTRPTGYYVEDPQPIPVDADKRFDFFGSSYTFKESGHYGFTVVFKIDGIEKGSSVKLCKWYCVVDGLFSSSQSHSFNYDFRTTVADGQYTYGKTFTENGYYVMYCPLYSVSKVKGPSVAGTTAVGDFSFNRASGANKTEDSDLNGNEITITPIALIEGAATEYSVTFKTDDNEYVYNGKYAFKYTDAAKSGVCQFVKATSALNIYKGEDISGLTKEIDGVKVNCAGWSSRPGDTGCVLNNSYVPLGHEVFYPNYLIDMNSINADTREVALSDGFDGQGVFYSVDESTGSAVVGEASGWSSKITEGANICGSIIIPAKVIIDGKSYAVTAINDLCINGCDRIVIPSSVEKINEKIFKENKGVVVCCYGGSAAERFAEEKGLDTYEFVTHEHTYGDLTQIVAPTCTNPGVKERLCTVCGKSEKESVGALGHEFSEEWTIDREATRTKAGIKSHHCIRCRERTDVTEFTVIFADVVFNDVKADTWYYDAVQYALDHGLFSGVSKNQFAPDAAMTRAMLVEVLYNLEGRPELESDESVFTDVKKDDWFAKSVTWAEASGVVNGTTDTTFSPDDSITREQLSAILYRYASLKEYDATATTELNAFPDGDKVSDYAKDAIKWAVGAGLISGNKIGNVNMLDARGTASRAQVAMILKRFSSVAE